MCELVFAWDANKAYENVRKHHVSLEKAKTIFNDPWLVTFSDEYHSNREPRYISMGTSPIGPGFSIRIRLNLKMNATEAVKKTLVACRHGELGGAGGFGSSI